MRDAQGTSHPEPTTLDKVHFWMGGSIPNTFNAWAQERIRSKWFPLRRMVPVVVTAALWFVFALASDRSLTYLLLVATLPIFIGLPATFVFRDRLRRRALRRYQTRVD